LTSKEWLRLRGGCGPLFGLLGDFDHEFLAVVERLPSLNP